VQVWRPPPVAFGRPVGDWKDAILSKIKHGIWGVALVLTTAILMPGSGWAQVTPDPAAPTQTQPDTTPAAAPALPAEVAPLAQEAPPLAGPTVPAATLPHDLSPWGMFLAADLVVKTVMIGLALASVLTWTVLVAKTLELAGARRRARIALGAITHARTLDEALHGLAKRKGMGVMLLKAAAEEVDLSAQALAGTDGSGLKERVASRLSRLVAAAGRRLARGTGLLATIGSIAPFVGLFGTVWGIMNSFIGISEAQTTNLAVVAPGIAEALLATAIGLVAAIPAVVIYNVFARAITGYRQLLGDIAAGIERLVSRDLDFERTHSRQPAPLPRRVLVPVAEQA